MDFVTNERIISETYFKFFILFIDSLSHYNQCSHVIITNDYVTTQGALGSRLATSLFIESQCKKYLLSQTYKALTINIA